MNSMRKTILLTLAMFISNAQCDQLAFTREAPDAKFSLEPLSPTMLQWGGKGVKYSWLGEPGNGCCKDKNNDEHVCQAPQYVCCNVEESLGKCCAASDNQCQ